MEETLEEVVGLLQSISAKLTSIDLHLSNIESNTSGTESNTGDIFYVKSELEDANGLLKKIYKK
ncbi:hypothetical protein [Anaerosporobacter sp.]